jgi:nitroreductase/dihydropteridine reductase
MSFISQLNWRYAVKKFNGQKISPEQLQKIKDAIRFAPSSFGAQPYHVVIVSDKNILQKLKPYAENNETKFDTCSHMFVFCARTDVQARFEGIEKLQGRPKGTLSKIGFNFQNFMPIVCGVKLGRPLRKYFWSMAQAYLALGFGLAACAELEVDSCPMEGFNSKNFQVILNLPSHIKPVALMAVGFRAEDDKIYPKARFPESDMFTEIS